MVRELKLRLFIGAGDGFERGLRLPLPQAGQRLQSIVRSPRARLEESRPDFRSSAPSASSAFPPPRPPLIAMSSLITRPAWTRLVASCETMTNTDADPFDSSPSTTIPGAMRRESESASWRRPSRPRFSAFLTRTLRPSTSVTLSSAAAAPCASLSRSRSISRCASRI